jgi:Domain of unknown function (DUF4124)
MHPWRPWIILASLAAFAGQAAVVYKWTDSDGVIHYSDQPVPGAEKIFTASSPTPGGSASSGRTPGPAGSKKSVAPGLNYGQFSITSPLPEQTFFGDDVISVHLALEPSLKPGQTITWHLNGKQLEDTGSVATQFALPHLDRGTYALAASITDQTTGESASTDSVTFYVRQPSALSPQHQKP